MRLLKAAKHLDQIPVALLCLRRMQNPVAILRRYLGLGAGGYPIQMKLKNGIRIDLENFHDLVTAWIIFLRQEYQTQADTKTILDIGGNIGCYSISAAHEHPAARVIAVEPFPATFGRLQANVALNKMEDRIRCLNLGIAAAAGVRVMSESGPSQSRGLLEAGATVPDGVSVSVLTLEGLLAKALAELNVDRLDFLKMDIEGAEHEAILTTPAAALKPIVRLGMEYHPNQPKARLFDYLIAAGLKLESDQIMGRDHGVAHFQRS